MARIANTLAIAAWFLLSVAAADCVAKVGPCAQRQDYDETSLLQVNKDVTPGSKRSEKESTENTQAPVLTEIAESESRPPVRIEPQPDGMKQNTRKVSVEALLPLGATQGTPLDSRGVYLKGLGSTIESHTAMLKDQLPAKMPVTAAQPAGTSQATAVAAGAVRTAGASQGTALDSQIPIVPGVAGIAPGLGSPMVPGLGYPGLGYGVLPGVAPGLGYAAGYGYGTGIVPQVVGAGYGYGLPYGAGLGYPAAVTPTAATIAVDPIAAQNIAAVPNISPYYSPGVAMPPIYR